MVGKWLRVGGRDVTGPSLTEGGRPIRRGRVNLGVVVLVLPIAMVRTNCFLLFRYFFYDFV